MRYRYEIHFHAQLGWIHTDEGEWHWSIGKVEEDCLRRIKTKKWRNQNYEDIGNSCLIDVYVVCDKKSNEYPYTSYTVLKCKMNVFFPDDLQSVTLQNATQRPFKQVPYISNESNIHPIFRHYIQYNQCHGDTPQCIVCGEEGKLCKLVQLMDTTILCEECFEIQKAM